MTGHTPGPWHWVNSNTDEPYDFDTQWDGNGYPSLRTVDEYGENKVENLPDGGTRTHYALPRWVLDAEPMEHGNDSANALLIAAAPDLLESASMVISLFNYRGDDATDYAAHVEAKLKAAIAKATGETV